MIPRELFQIETLFDTIFDIADGWAGESYDRIGSLASIGKDIVRYHSAVVDGKTSDVDDARDLTSLKGLPREVIAEGYQAANAWYADLDKRASDASGHFIPSNLRQAFDALPLGQHGAFLDAIGTLFVTWKVRGEPSADDRFDIAKSIALDAMTPAEQDALSDASLATHAGGQS